jgi:lysophospholipase L1-like esterase
MMSAVIIILGTLCAVYIVHLFLNSPPENNPASFLKRSHFKEGHVMVTIGDSLTHGTASGNYSNSIKQVLEGYNFQTVNAGMNSDLSITALRKVDKVIECKPTIVSILIGTNDILASQGSIRRNSYVKIGRLKKDDRVSENEYQKNLTQLVRQLQAAEIKHIFLISLPLIGEDISQDINKCVESYSHRVKNVAVNEGVCYVPLFETMCENIKNKTDVSAFSWKREFKSYVLNITHYLSDIDLDRLFKHYGYHYLTDGIHLNTKGSDLVSTLLLKSITEQNLPALNNNTIEN